MLTYRPFRNTDPPALAAIWERQPPLRARLPTLPIPILERVVLAKTFFDRQGLIVATAGKVVCGFVHAAIGPTPDGSQLDPAKACISMLCVPPNENHAAIAADLIARAESYLKSRGATRITAGECGRNAPHYLGIYGGSAGCGILAADEATLAAYRAAGYAERDRLAIWQRELAGFKPPVSAKAIQVKRTTIVDIDYEASPANWWDACTVGAGYAQRFAAAPTSGAPPVAQAVFWEVDPLGPHWKVRTAGLWHLFVSPEQRRKGYGTYLLSEALKSLAAQGYGRAEAIFPRSDAAGLGLIRKLGFAEIEAGVVLEKSV